MCEVGTNIIQKAQLMLVLPMQVALKNLDFQRYQKGYCQWHQYRRNRAQFLALYIKRITYLKDPYHICNVNQCYHTRIVNKDNSSTKNMNHFEAKTAGAYEVTSIMNSLTGVGIIID